MSRPVDQDLSCYERDLALLTRIRSRAVGNTTLTRAQRNALITHLGQVMQILNTVVETKAKSVGSLAR